MILEGISGPALDDAIAKVTDSLPTDKRNAFGFAVTEDGVGAGVRMWLDDADTWQGKAYAGVDFHGKAIAGLDILRVW